MTHRRCYLPDPEFPGSLQLITIAQGDYCAPFQRCCLEKALKKWQALFTVRILEYTLCEMGIVLLVFIPNCPLSDAEALERTTRFDESLRKAQKGQWRSKSHMFDARKLNSLSDFMRIFMREFLMGHRRFPVPKNLPEGAYPYPRQQGRYKSRCVQYDALPPVFSSEQLLKIQLALEDLGFPPEGGTREICELHMSPHGIGTISFLEKLELRCQAYLLEISGKSLLPLRCPTKRIVPFDPDVWDRRLGELAKMLPYEHYPKMWSLIKAADLTVDALLQPETFAFGGIGHPRFQNDMVTNCLPVSLSLMLCDGLLRWYYRETKGVEFPHYNCYGEM